MTSGPRLLGLAAAVAAAGCSAARPLRPLPPGGWAAEVSVPAVWVESGGARFPVGPPVLGVRRGLAGRTEAALRWNPGLVALKILGVDGAATWHATPPRGPVPALHLTGTLSLLVAPAHLGGGVSHAVRGAVAGDATLHWEPCAWAWPYLVQQEAVVLASGRSLLSTLAGVQVHPSPRWELSLEGGVAAWNADARKYTQHYVDVRGHGGLWLGGAVGYRFGGPPQGATP